MRMFNHLENRAEKYFMKERFYKLTDQVPGVADAGEGAGPDVRRPGAL